MNLTYLRFSQIIILTALLCYGCTDLEFTEIENSKLQKLDLSSRTILSPNLLDSTVNAEKIISNNLSQFPSNNSELAQLNSTYVNYASQAVVSAESTFPGYSVQNIKDGNTNTTAGPSYSWTNDFPAGGKLPESVFFRFNSLKRIDRIDIYLSSGYVMQDYTIQYRGTATGIWRNLLVVTGNTSVARSHNFSAIDLLEIQIICQKGPSNQTIYGRLNEVQIFGPAEPTLPPISVQNGMLVFNSVADVNKAISYLEFKYDQHSSAFVGQYPGYTDDQLADIEDATGFNDEQPFAAFENQFGISSLRAKLTAEEDQWLANTSGDEFASYPDPEDSYNIDEVEMRTLINKYGEIKVGATKYIFKSDGSYSLVTQTTTLTQGQPLPENIEASSASVPTCRAIVKNKGFKYNSDKTWRMKWKVKAADGPFGGNGKAKAITKSYRRKNGQGRWKSRSATIEAYVYGSIVGTDCTTSTRIESPIERKKRRKVKAKVPYNNGRVLKEAVMSSHSHSKVSGVYQHKLTW